MTIDAASIMTRKVITVRPEATVAEISKVLSQHGISAVPVCDNDGRLVGMVSEGDLMRPFAKANALRRSWWLGMIAEGTDLAPEFVDYLRLDRHCARDLMTKEVVSAREDTRVTEIADLLATRHIKRVPIVREGKLVGIVSRADIVAALARSPKELSEPS